MKHHLGVEADLIGFIQFRVDRSAAPGLRVNGDLVSDRNHKGCAPPNPEARIAPEVAEAEVVGLSREGWVNPEDQLEDQPVGAVARDHLTDMTATGAREGQERGRPCGRILRGVQQQETHALEFGFPRPSAQCRPQNAGSTIYRH